MTIKISKTIIETFANASGERTYSERFVVVASGDFVAGVGESAAEAIADAERLVAEQSVELEGDVVLMDQDGEAAGYEVRNDRDALIKIFDDRAEAEDFARENDGCGLMFGLRVVGVPA